MMDRLDSVFRRYERLRSDSTTEPGVELQAEAFVDWIDRDVCPVVQELLERSDFRKWARWPVERLEEGASGTERGLIEAVDAALVHAAETLSTFGGLAVVQSALLHGEAASVGEATSMFANGQEDIGQLENEAPAERPAAKAVPQALASVKFIASRPWGDLVTIGDYFAPVNDLNLRDREAFLGLNSRHVQIGAFLPYCNPRLRPLGDLVSRTLLIRVEFWQDMLQKFWVRCQRIALENHLVDCEKWSKASASMGDLSKCAEALRHALMDDRRLRLREACLTLVQIYASFRPLADFSFLGPVAKLACNADGFCYFAKRRQALSIPEQVEAALTEVAGLYRNQEDQEERIRELSMRHSLLIVEGPGRREAYWNGELLDTDWQKHEKPWSLLLAMAERQMHGLGADAFDVNCSPKDARYRLRQLIPDELNKHIVPAGQGTYKLGLAKEDVCVLQCQEQQERFVPSAIAARGR